VSAGLGMEHGIRGFVHGRTVRAGGPYVKRACSPGIVDTLEIIQLISERW
jgi:hypothetical protein